MGIYIFEGHKPSIGKGTFVHPDATIIGDVTIGSGCYIGAGACIRGDWGSIEIGANSNIQENCVIHVFPDKKAVLGPRSHVGHGAILHTPTLGEHVLVGMGAIIMDYAEIGDGCCIGAGALIVENTIFPPFKLILGAPAKAVADINEQKRRALDGSTAYYVALPLRCHESLTQVTLKECMSDEGCV